MVDWEVTEATIFCDAVAVNVTMTICHDGSAKCTGNRKYNEKLTKKELKKMKSRGQKLGKKLRCEGLQCPRLVQYKTRLLHRQ